MKALRTLESVRSDSPYSSLRLAGDGDEIDAISDVERAFGVKLDYSTAGSWFTAGDVYTALLKVLPPGTSYDLETWKRFAAAIVDCTGLDPERVTLGTTLIERNNIWQQLWQGLRKTLS